ncbi:MAG TPA: hypothetical protein VFI92_12500 [Steroidobacteraceae bacterium]|nr:hypothetical protein [Steroidobacteraceae bacterium]
MNSRTRANTLVDPQSAYREPRFVLEDESRSDAEKIQLLLDWRQDLLELQTAAEENMPDQRSESNGATRLQAVMDALITLGYKSE